MLGFHPTSAAPVASLRSIYVAAGGGLDAVVTLGQGSQSVAATATVATAATVTLGQGSQSVVAAATVATAAAVTLGQGSQSVAAAGTVSIAGAVTLGQGSQSVSATGSVSMAATVALGQGSQSVAASASIGGGAALDAVVTLGQGSQSVAATVTIGDEIVIPPTTGGGMYILPASQDRSEPAPRDLERHYVPIRREPFEVTLKPAGDDLKALRDRLYELGRLLDRKKETVRNRIRTEQAARGRPVLSPERLLILQTLIDEYELELYNQNAARLLILLAETC